VQPDRTSESHAAKTNNTNGVDLTDSNISHFPASVAPINNFGVKSLSTFALGGYPFGLKDYQSSGAKINKQPSTERRSTKSERFPPNFQTDSMRLTFELFRTFYSQIKR
jgi:hypothetical protein